MALTVRPDLSPPRLPRLDPSPVPNAGHANAPAAPIGPMMQPASQQQAQLLEALLAQLAAYRGAAAPHGAGNTALEFTQVADDQWISDTGFHWHDAPPELLATCQDGGRRMMTSLLAFYAR
ncbi:MAG: hypothetical protein AAF707_00400 [Pseudomonadota bacterium]